MATCRASLDKSGRAGVQKIHLMQPLIDNDFDVRDLPHFFPIFWWMRGGGWEKSDGLESATFSRI